MMERIIPLLVQNWIIVQKSWERKISRECSELGGSANPSRKLFNPTSNICIYMFSPEDQHGSNDNGRQSTRDDIFKLVATTCCFGSFPSAPSLTINWAEVLANQLLIQKEVIQRTYKSIANSKVRKFVWKPPRLLSDLKPNIVIIFL